jgi:hypothetical protein
MLLQAAQLEFFPPAIEYGQVGKRLADFREVGGKATSPTSARLWSPTARLSGTRLWATALASAIRYILGDFLLRDCAVPILVGLLHHLLETSCLLGDFVFGELAVFVGVEATQKCVGRNRPPTSATCLATLSSPALFSLIGALSRSPTCFGIIALRKSSLTPHQGGQ